MSNLEDQLRLERIKKLRRNLPKAYALSFFYMFLVIMPVMIPFLGSLGLNMTEAFLLQAFFGAIVLLLEVPSGYASDLLGRKGTLAVFGVAWIFSVWILVFATEFWHLLAFEFFAAIAAAFVSGSDNALIYDSLDEIRQLEGSHSFSDQTGSHFLGKKVFYSQTGETLAALLGGAAAAYSLRHPVYVQAAISWIPLLIVLSLTEPERRDRMHRSQHLDNFKKIFTLLAQQPLVRKAITHSLFFGSATLIGAWAFQKQWQVEGIELAHFGYLWALFNLTVALAGASAHRLSQSWGVPALVLLSGLLPILGYFSMAYWSGTIAVLCGLLLNVGRGFNQVVVRDIYQSRVPSSMRATVDSIQSLGVRSLYILLGPVSGWVMDHSSVNLSFIFLGIFYILVFLMISMPLLKALQD